MDSNSDSSSVIDSIRRSDVSRRGGVRVRGGRLPPIRIRDTAALQPAANKKVIAPKIPPRRIKKEAPSTYGENGDNRRNSETSNSRQRSAQGRGRGPKVYLQSEGTFLGEGPALKLKKEVQTASYERGSRVKVENTKFDPEVFKYLLEDYDGDEFCFEEESLMMPVRFPIVKQEIKTETKGEIKQEMKEDISDIGDVKSIIKKEPFESLEEKCDLKENKLLDQLKKVDILQTESSNSLDDQKFLKGEDALLYLQLPSCLPFKKYNQSTSADTSSKVPEKTNPEAEMETSQVTLKDIGEGHIGKLQILRSGKMRFVLGSVKMAVESAVEVPTFCDAICISIENEDEANAVVIGNVEQKMVLRPLFSDIEDKTGILEDTY